MELVGLEPRRNDLARGIVIARSTAPISAEAQRALWDALAAAGVTELGEDGHDFEDETARQWLAAPWIPPASEQVESQRAALVEAAARHGIEKIWLVKVETGIDGVMWQEMTRSDASADDEDDDDEGAGADGGDEPSDAPRDVSELVDDGAEVVYAAPDVSGAIKAAIVPGNIADAGIADEDDADDDEDADEDEGDLESHWRAGSPPFENSVTFPIEGYPEILADYDWESFGVAVKLAGDPLPGEESVINAFFALWLSAYQDERAEGFEAFQRADVVHDREHRSALMWVERFAVPATASEQVHFLLWVCAQIHAILPIAWARFDSVDDAVKARAMVDDTQGTPFVLAGNPFADRFHRQSEEAALAWAVAQSAWSRRELAGMLVEVALEHDPDDAAAATVAERLLRRALAFDPQCDATGYLAIVMIRQQRIADAIALAKEAPLFDVRLLVVGETAEHAPGQLDATLALLDADTLRETPPEDLADLVATVAKHAPSYLQQVLARLPAQVELVPHLYNASFTVERPQGLAILRKVLSLPEPSKDMADARSAYVMAWNNACIHAHALGDYQLARELADGGLQYGAENPYIYHSAACAYAAVGQIDRAIDQVAQAIEHDYEHSEKMETDVDLAVLQKDPRFGQLFVDWRERRADLN